MTFFHEKKGKWQSLEWSELSCAPGSTDLTGGDEKCRKDKL
jgi:hypothetical protein